MTKDFHLIDLLAQAVAVEQLIQHMSEAEKMLWLARYGDLSVVTKQGGVNTYRFKSVSGPEATFFFRDTKLVFLGDHSSFVVEPD